MSPPVALHPLVERNERMLAHSLKLVLPSRTAPARRRRATISASCVGGRVDQGERPGRRPRSPGGVDVVLDEHGDAVQRAARASRAPLFVELAGDGARIGIELEHASQRGARSIERADAHQIAIDEIDGAQARAAAFCRRALRSSLLRSRGAGQAGAGRWAARRRRGGASAPRQLDRAGGAGGQPHGEQRASIHGAYTKSAARDSAPANSCPTARFACRCSGWQVANLDAERQASPPRMRRQPDAARVMDGTRAVPAAARTEQHLAAIDHDPPDLDVGGALAAVRRRSRRSDEEGAKAASISQVGQGPAPATKQPAASARTSASNSPSKRAKAS